MPDITVNVRVVGADQASQQLNKVGTAASEAGKKSAAASGGMSAFSKGIGTATVGALSFIGGMFRIQDSFDNVAKTANRASVAQRRADESLEKYNKMVAAANSTQKDFTKTVTTNNGAIGQETDHILSYNAATGEAVVQTRTANGEIVRQTKSMKGQIPTVDDLADAWRKHTDDQDRATIATNESNQAQQRLGTSVAGGAVEMGFGAAAVGGFVKSLIPAAPAAAAAAAGASKVAPAVAEVGAAAGGSAAAVGVFGAGVGIIGATAGAMKGNLFGARDAIGGTANALQKADPALKSTGTFIDGLMKKAGVLPDPFKTANTEIATGTAGIGRSIQKMGQVGGQGITFVTKGFEQFSKQITSGDVGGAIDTVVGGVGQGFEKLKTIGAKFTSAHIFPTAGALGESLTKGLETLKQNILNFKMPTLGGLVDFARQIMTMFGFEKIFDFVMNGLGRIGTAFTQWVTGIPGWLAGGAGAIAGAITGWVTGVGGKIAAGASQLATGFTKWVTGIGGWLAGGATAIGQAITNWVTGVGSTIGAGAAQLGAALWKGITSGLGSLWGAIVEKAGQAGAFFANAGAQIWNAITGALGNLWGAIVAVAGSAAAVFAGAGAQIWNAITTGLGNLWGAIVAIAGSAAAVFAGAGAQIWNAITTGLGNLWGAIVAIAGSAAAVFAGAGAQIWNAITTGLGNLWGAIVAIAGSAAAVFAGAGAQIWNAITTGLGNLWGAILAVAGSAAAVFSGAGAQIWNAITTGLGNLWGAILAVAGSAAAVFAGAGAQIWNAITTGLGNLWGAILAIAGAAGAIFAGAGAQIWNAITTGLGNLWGAILAIAGAAGAVFSGAGAQIWNAITTGLGSLWGAIVAVAGDPVSIFTVPGAKIWAAITSGIGDIYGAIVAAAGDPVGAFGALGTKIWGALKAAIGAAAGAGKAVLNAVFGGGFAAGGTIVLTPQQAAKVQAFIKQYQAQQAAPKAPSIGQLGGGTPTASSAYTLYQQRQLAAAQPKVPTSSGGVKRLASGGSAIIDRPMSFGPNLSLAGGFSPELITLVPLANGGGAAILNVEQLKGAHAPARNRKEIGERSTWLGGISVPIGSYSYGSGALGAATGGSFVVSKPTSFGNVTVGEGYKPELLTFLPFEDGVGGGILNVVPLTRKARNNNSASGGKHFATGGSAIIGDLSKGLAKSVLTIGVEVDSKDAENKVSNLGNKLNDSLPESKKVVLSAEASGFEGAVSTIKSQLSQIPTQTRSTASMDATAATSAVNSFKAALLAIPATKTVILNVTQTGASIVGNRTTAQTGGSYLLSKPLVNSVQSAIYASGQSLTIPAAIKQAALIGGAISQAQYGRVGTNVAPIYSSGAYRTNVAPTYSTSYRTNAAPIGGAISQAMYGRVGTNAAPTYSTSYRTNAAPTYSTSYRTNVAPIGGAISQAMYGSIGTNVAPGGGPAPGQPGYVGNVPIEMYGNVPSWYYATPGNYTATQAYAAGLISSIPRQVTAATPTYTSAYTGSAGGPAPIYSSSLRTNVAPIAGAPTGGSRTTSSGSYLPYANTPVYAIGDPHQDRFSVAGIMAYMGPGTFNEVNTFRPLAPLSNYRGKEGGRFLYSAARGGSFIVDHLMHFGNLTVGEGRNPELLTLYPFPNGGGLLDVVPLKGANSPAWARGSGGMMREGGEAWVNNRSMFTGLRNAVSRVSGSGHGQGADRLIALLQKLISLQIHGGAGKGLEANLFVDGQRMASVAQRYMGSRSYGDR